MSVTTQVRFAYSKDRMNELESLVTTLCLNVL